jgi:hypothetical protein
MATFLSSTEDLSPRVLASVLSIICFLSPATAQQRNASSKDRLGLYDDPVGYDLLSIILEKETRQSSDQLVRIYRRTDSKLLVWLERHAVPKEFLGAAEDLKHRAKGRERFREQRFSLSHRYKLVDYDGPPEPANYVPLADGTVPPPSEADLDNKISSGVLSVSAVGFDQTKTHAIASVDFVCGTLCGGGRFYFLEKQETGWQAKDVGGDWVH